MTLYLEAGFPDEAARVLELRAQAAPSVRERLELIEQAVRCAPEPRKLELRKRRARMRLEAVRSGYQSALPLELSELGQELSELGEHALAAEAHALSGDVTRQAHALVEAGEIERLETLLEHDVKRTRTTLERQRLASDLRDLDAAGQRRALLRVGYGAKTRDAECESLLRAVEAKRIVNGRVNLEIDGRPRDFVFGRTVRIGRADADIVVPSPAMSRAHLEIGSSDGVPVVRDLGSSNGTLFRGAKLRTALTVREPIELLLGGEVPVELVPEAHGVWLHLAGMRCFAPLGPYEVDGWRLERAEDGWLELDTRAREAYLGGLRVSGRVEICRGDAFSVSSLAVPRLRVVA